MGAFNIFDPEAPKALGSEGKLDGVEQLAIMLACSTHVGADAGPMRAPTERLEMLEIWAAKSPGVQAAYRLRARRLLRAWGAT